MWGFAWKEGKFEFGKLSKPTYSAEWGEGKGVASLKDLLGETEAGLYKQFVSGFKGNDYYSAAGVRLTYERLGHIFERHPEVNLNLISTFLERAIKNPDYSKMSSYDEFSKINYVLDNENRWWAFIVVNKDNQNAFIATIRRARDKGK